MNEKFRVSMKVIRYSKPFKLQLVREVETGKASAWAVQQKYKIKGGTTVMRWVRQFGRPFPTSLSVGDDW